MERIHRVVRVADRAWAGFAESYAALGSAAGEVITQLRHHQSLVEAISAGRALISGLKEGVSPEFLASDMRKMLMELGAIIGQDVTEEILSAIFSKFCIGK